MELISRKQFLKQAVFKAARLSINLLDTLRPPQKKQMMQEPPPFYADLSPQILADEAERLGLAPNDKDAVLAAISERLNKPTSLE